MVANTSAGAGVWVFLRFLEQVFFWFIFLGVFRFDYSSGFEKPKANDSCSLQKKTNSPLKKTPPKSTKHISKKHRQCHPTGWPTKIPRKNIKKHSNQIDHPTTTEPPQSEGTFVESHLVAQTIGRRQVVSHRGFRRHSAARFPVFRVAKATRVTAGSGVSIKAPKERVN